MSNEGIVLGSLMPSEIPWIMKELETYAHIKISEREFKKMIAERNVFKITSDFSPIGIVAITPSTLPEISVWLSDLEPKEKWSRAIEKIISKAFEKPDVFKIKWLLTESLVEMIGAAANCGFIKEGELRSEGLNRETIFSFGLSRNGNSPETSPEKNSGPKEENSDKNVLNEKIFFLEEELAIAREKNKDLHNYLAVSDERRRITEENLLAAREEIARLTDTLTKMLTEAQDKKPKNTGKISIDNPETKTEKTQPNKRNTEPGTLSEEKTVHEINQIRPAAAPENKPIRFNKREMEILKIIAESKSAGILQKDIYNGGYGYYQTEVSLAIRKFAKKGAVINTMIGKRSHAFPVMEEIKKQFPEVLKNKPEEKPVMVQEKSEENTEPVVAEKNSGKKIEPAVNLAANNPGATAAIKEHHIEKAKKLLKANAENGMNATDLLKKLGLPCNKKTAEDLIWFIGKFAFIEGNTETEFDKCRIKIWNGIASAIKRGNAVLETIKKHGVKKLGGQEEYQINFGILCQKMAESGYNDPDKIKKSIQFLKNDPDAQYQIYIIHAQKGALDNNDVIKLVRL